MTHNLYDVIIVGGSYAGLSAAMSLGRSLRKVLVIDSGMPCNRQTPHSHNFLTQDGRTPGEISTLAREQVAQYNTVQFYNDVAIQGTPNDNGFEITTQSGEKFTGKKLIFATGVKDMMPEIKGFAECWGISVVHCPYCHGYEHRKRKTAILANGEKAFHLASLVNNLTDDLTVLTSGIPEFSEDQRNKLQQCNIEVIENEVTEILHESGEVKSLLFKNGDRQKFDAVYAAIPFVQHSDIPVSLGCELTEHGHIKVDDFHKTSVDGIFACGDNTSMMRSVANAVHSGNLTGALVNKELTTDRF